MVANTPSVKFVEKSTLVRTPPYSRASTFTGFVGTLAQKHLQTEEVHSPCSNITLQHHFIISVQSAPEITLTFHPVLQTKSASGPSTYLVCSYCLNSLEDINSVAKNLGKKVYDIHAIKYLDRQQSQFERRSRQNMVISTLEMIDAYLVPSGPNIFGDVPCGWICEREQLLRVTYEQSTHCTP